jgi:hypothetical protein
MGCGVWHSGGMVSNVREEVVRASVSWDCHVPVHVAGSGGNTFIGRIVATYDEISAAFGQCATISQHERTVRFFKRPSPSR